MAELLLVMLCVGTLAGLALLSAAPPLTLAWTSLALTGLGLVVGISSGAWYHLALRRELRKMGELPRDWILRPTRYHAALDSSARRRVLPWFFVGGTSFGLTVLGFVIGILMFLRMR